MSGLRLSLISQLRGLALPNVSFRGSNSPQRPQLGGLALPGVPAQRSSSPQCPQLGGLSLPDIPARGSSSPQSQAQGSGSPQHSQLRGPALPDIPRSGVWLGQHRWVTEAAPRLEQRVCPSWGQRVGFLSRTIPGQKDVPSCCPLLCRPLCPPPHAPAGVSAREGWSLLAAAMSALLTRPSGTTAACRPVTAVSL